ncbi:MAG TPA: hypothetical protein VKZ95_01530 [Sphingobacteriaceae bacterium]|nr:hypothetical protein [Sphingobacteriaceae bacterium]
MELILKNVQEKHIGLIAELARTLKITIEGVSETDLKKVKSEFEEEKANHAEGLFHSWIKK